MAIIDNIISLFGRNKPRAEALPPRETAETSAPPPLFSSDRIFYQSGFRNQDPGWYFHARGGAIRGPYFSRSLAQAHLNTFIARCRETQDSGGRANSGEGGSAT